MFARGCPWWGCGRNVALSEQCSSAQAGLGVVAGDYVAVQYVAETSWLSEAGRFVPTLLLIGFFFMLSRGAAGLGGMGGGGAGGIFNVGKSKAVQDSLGGCEANDVELKQRIDEVRQLGLHRGKLDAKEDGAG